MTTGEDQPKPVVFDAWGVPFRGVDGLPFKPLPYEQSSDFQFTIGNFF